MPDPIAPNLPQADPMAGISGPAGQITPGSADPLSQSGLEGLSGANLSGVAPSGSPAAPSQPAPAAKPQSTLNRILNAVAIGLSGAAAGAGAKNIGQAAAAGARTGTEMEQQGIENRQRQQQINTQQQQAQSQIHFQNIQAAESVARASYYDTQKQYMSEQTRDMHEQASEREYQFFTNTLGLQPMSVSDKSSAGATAALQKVSADNNGVPHARILEIGGQYFTFDLSKISGPLLLNTANQYSDMFGGPQQNPQTLQLLSDETKRNLVQRMATAISGGTPDMPDVKTATEVGEQYKVLLNTYTDRKGNNADPGVVKNLEHVIDLADQTRKDFTTAANKQAADQITAQTNARVAAETSPANVKAQADAAASKASAEEKARLAAQTQGAGADMFGNSLPAMTRQERDSKSRTFSKDYVEPANKLERTAAQMNSILDRAKSGQMTGADSVVGLFDAIGISADTLKGGGFRVNQSTVGEHSGARNILQDAAVKLNKISGVGEAVTPQQLQDYGAILSGVRHDLYTTAANEAQRQGLPVDFLPKGNGKVIDPQTAKIYLDVAGGDVQKAHQAVLASGWK